MNQRLVLPCDVPPFKYRNGNHSTSNHQMLQGLPLIFSPSRHVSWRRFKITFCCVRSNRCGIRSIGRTKSLSQNVQSNFIKTNQCPTTNTFFVLFTSIRFDSFSNIYRLSRAIMNFFTECNALNVASNKAWASSKVKQEAPSNNSVKEKIPKHFNQDCSFRFIETSPIASATAVKVVAKRKKRQNWSKVVSTTVRVWVVLRKRRISNGNGKLLNLIN